MKSKWYTISIGLCLVLICAGTPASAQRYNGHGYAFASVEAPNGGTLTNMLSAGGGGEGFVWKGLAAGGELSYLFPREYPSEGVGMFSVNAAYHFVNRDRPGKLVPFVTAGYTLGFRTGTANMVNWGGGVTWWMFRRVGLRTEVRSYEYAGEGGGHFSAGLRFGVQIR